ncbi:glycosyltransferase family 2 protein [Botrimarina hoheduenensis]|uniref:UDP-Glc:alpha-D-GlcNAc-diphosphoundecaprenol beta-1,3-glucosyltransferase WfgD n=1 Tax=Botrimarina hoheduenensis TaxID=2528000 RepID=A0A5C5WA75_9BACT|nr:glycosyltransferase [Botrimarina hoheduenensis]TWT47397.1 UDP-Glc:alpha-D-GlcNAc-diphosphoundecaprenol beta-1,3-glucosyltransferase WfgD [Botrimarina hoheduenensis]
MENLPFKYAETFGLVSIIMPTRNGRRYLVEALQGISNQNYPNWELIVVEDGSQDGAEELVRQFAGQHLDNRVVYRRNETSCGAAYTRNLAFLESAGEYVAFHDCDDKWLPTHLQACVSTLEETGDDLAYSTVVMFADADGSTMGVWGPTSWEVQSFPQSMFGRSYVTPSATVTRRSVIGEIGVWDSQYHCCEDADFMMRAAYAGKRFRYVPGVHCLYRKEHDGATTQKLAQTIEESSLIAKRYLSMPGIDGRAARHAVAATMAVAAKLHQTRPRTIDPSATPSRAARIYARAWRLHRSRWRYLFKAVYSACRYGVSKGVQPIYRPNLPPWASASAPIESYAPPVAAPLATQDRQAA